MEKIKVLIVDDSIIYRSLIKATLDHLDFIEVVGVASNGRIALEKIKVIKTDLVILDLEMPEMDGKMFLSELQSFQVRPKVILFSGQTERGAKTTLECLSLGASDFIPKPKDQSSEDPKEKLKNLLLPRIQSLFSISSPSLDTKVNTTKVNVVKKISGSIWELYKPKIIVIGSSTGGPMALEAVFSKVRGNLRCPIVITQHMPPLFTATLAERLEKITGITCREAVDGEELKNRIYMAPGNYHLRLSGNKSKTFIHLDQGELINFVRPAVDPLFDTAADIFKEGCLGIVLTGMGSDGKNGSKTIKDNAGIVVIQNEESCVVFGMPGAVFNQGTFDFVQDLEELSDLLFDKSVANF